MPNPNDRVTKDQIRYLQHRKLPFVDINGTRVELINLHLRGALMNFRVHGQDGTGRIRATFLEIVSPGVGGQLSLQDRQGPYFAIATRAISYVTVESLLRMPCARCNVWAGIHLLVPANSEATMYVHRGACPQSQAKGA